MFVPVLEAIKTKVLAKPPVNAFTNPFVSPAFVFFLIRFRALCHNVTNGFFPFAHIPIGYWLRVKTENYGFFRPRFSFRAAVTVRTRGGWTAVAWLFLTNEKKQQHQKAASYAGIPTPISNMGSLRLVFIMRAREKQSII